MKLDNVKFLPKILACFALFTAVVIGAIWYAASRMQMIDGIYKTILSEDVQGMKYGLRANQRVYNFGRLNWRAIAETKADDLKKTSAEMDDNVKEFSTYVSDAKKHLPRHGEMLAKASAMFDGIMKDFEPVSKMILARETDLAVAASQNIARKTALLREAMREVTAEIEKDMQANANAATDTVNNTVLLTAVMVGGAALSVIIIAFCVVQFGISKPVRTLTKAMHGLAGGNLEIEVPCLGRKDEVGEMAEAVKVFKVNMVEAERLREQQQISEQQQAKQRRADMHTMADGFESAVGEIIEMVSSASTELEASASTMSRTAETTQGLSTVVAAASEEASANVQSVASATEEMSSSVSEISRQVQESSRIAGMAVSEARKTNDRVNDLSQAAARIGDVVGLISDIAAQTNLLALNATIEAARAGEAGRGFAVVASEVKALADQTAKATGDITRQIAGIQSATGDSVTAIREIGETIGRISEITSAIAAAVEEQGAATREISRNVQQAAQGTTEVASNITQVQRGASETGSSSGQVLLAAKSLSSESNRLKLEVGKFLQTVRAA